MGVGALKGKYMSENTLEVGVFSSFEELKAYYRNLPGRPKFPSSITAAQVQQGSTYFDIKTGGSTYPGYEETTRVYLSYSSH